MHIDFIDAIRSLNSAFEPEGIQWAVAGAVAANLYRDQVRSTSGLVVMLTLVDQRIETVTAALNKNGWTSIGVLDDWLLRAETSDSEQLDVLVSNTDYEREAISRAQTIDLGDSNRCKTLAVEDVLLLKLIADRFQDNADVESILATQPKIDWDYMSKWMEEFDLEERLRRIENAAIAAGRLSKKISRTPSRSRDSSGQEL